MAAVALACLGLVIVLACPSGPGIFCAAGLGLALMFGALLLALRAQKLAEEDPEDRAFARAVEAGHVNPGAIAMHVKGRRLIKEGRKENDPEKVKNGEWLVNRGHSFLKGGKAREGVPG
jgi:hypothetical protein